LIRVEGPLALAQLLETTFLTLVNYASLVATNAARFRIAAGPDKELLEFGLRRAQGPDGGFSASKYCVIGGFDGTSNVLAGKLLGLTVKGTHGHAFVQAFTCMDEVLEQRVGSEDSEFKGFKAKVLAKREELGWISTNNSELAAFTAYAIAFPDTFLALIDTYDTLGSGVRNFVIVALALDSMGHKPLGVRLDSGDLAYLSSEVQAVFKSVALKTGLDYFNRMTIVASNDINEIVLWALRKQEHNITAFGIGTNLVTCQAQPALGCVYKLVEIDGVARIKLSQDIAKVLIPGKKEAWRIFGESRKILLDVMVMKDEAGPVVGERFLCRHPFEEQKRVYVTPSRVEKLNVLAWDGKNGMVVDPPTIESARARVKEELGILRADHVRATNPTPVKVSVSDKLWRFLHTLWASEAPVLELK
jgi:nicotinate phosphoribosyltransferase